ncbi:hypothetical protein Tco_0487283 [Tanacetum coccineum]
MTSLSNKYERLNKIPSELGLNLALPLLEQDPSLPETYIADFHCHTKLPEGVKFVNNLVIEEPDHGLFLIDAFGDEAFQRVSDVHKVETESLQVYKVMASNVKTDANQRFNMSMSTMINERPGKDMILSKREEMEHLDRETSARVGLINSQKEADDLKVLQIDTREMDSVDVATINAQKVLRVVCSQWEDRVKLKRMLSCRKTWTLGDGPHEADMTKYKPSTSDSGPQ